jgi:hypothetical protein
MITRDFLNHIERWWGIESQNAIDDILITSLIEFIGFEEFISTLVEQQMSFLYPAPTQMDNFHRKMLASKREILTNEFKIQLNRFNRDNKLNKILKND